MLFTIQVEANSIQEAIAKLGFIEPPTAAMPAPQNIVQFPPQVPVAQPPVQAPAAPPSAQSTPAAKPATPPPAPVVPITAPTYTLDDLGRAAAALMDAGKMADLQQLTAKFGIAHMGALPPERYGEFANALRGLGAKL